MDPAMVFADGIDRRVGLNQNEAGARCIEEHHVTVRRGRQMPAGRRRRYRIECVWNVAYGYAIGNATTAASTFYFFSTANSPSISDKNSSHRTGSSLSRYETITFTGNI